MSETLSGYSVYTLIGDGVTTNFPIQFSLGTLRDDSVKVSVEGEVDGEGNQVYRTWERVIGDPGVMRVHGSPPGNGKVITFARKIVRDTLLHQYANGSVLNYPSLDESHLQLLMLCQELFDGLGLENVQTNINMTNHTITGLAVDESNPTSAATVGWTKELRDRAEQAAQQAEQSADASSASAAAAAASAGSAATSASASAASAATASNEADRATAAVADGLVQVVAAGDAQEARVVAAGDAQEAQVVAAGSTQVAMATTEANRSKAEADRAKSEADRAVAIVNIGEATTTEAGLVKLDALAADGSSTAAPGGFGLGMEAMPQVTDLNTAVKTGDYFLSSTAANAPLSQYGYLSVQSIGGHAKVQYVTSSEATPQRFMRIRFSGVWMDWVALPNGITDSTDLSSSTIAASATAVKALGQRIKTIEDAPPPSTDPWDAHPPYVPIPVWGVTFGGSDGRRAIMPGETAAREDWILCDGGNDGKGGVMPNLIDRTIIGVSASKTEGTVGGSATHTHEVTGSVSATTLSTEQMPSHSHRIQAHRTSSIGFNGAQGAYYDGDDISFWSGGVGGSGSHTHTLSSATASTASSYMPYCAINFIMKIV